MFTQKRRIIGLLGGSFNPAHGGHLHISLHALNRLGLDGVWWLVSPQNPLKERAGMAPFETRFASALYVTRGHKRINVTDIEQRLDSRYTHQTIIALQQRYPHYQFVWMMGADNLAQFHRWQRWRDIAARVPIIVFDRAPYSHHALRCKAAMAMWGNRLKLNHIARPWPRNGLLYLHMRRADISSTLLRKTLGNKAFLRHNSK